MAHERDQCIINRHNEAKVIKVAEEIQTMFPEATHPQAGTANIPLKVNELLS